MTPCIEWKGATAKGYGRAYHEGRLWQAHRLVLARKEGGDKPEYDAMHLCNNRLCVNPDHLEWGTRSANRLGVLKLQCKRGHLLEGDNLLITKQGRLCQACRRQGMAAYYRARRNMQNLTKGDEE